jgi:hypothetical protein
LELQSNVAPATELGLRLDGHDVRYRVVRDREHVWIVFALAGTDVARLRVGVGTRAASAVHTWADGDRCGLEYASALGAVRIHLELIGGATLRCVTSLLPTDDVRLAPQPRDLLMLGAEGTIFTHQRGLRSGIVFAGSSDPRPFSLFYVQNFTTLTPFFEATQTTPADTVGGEWPIIGYAPPIATDGVLLPAAQEIVISDAYLAVSADLPTREATIAAAYLDFFAQVYLALERPPVEYHPWNERAAAALRDLSLSPACTYERRDRRYLMPYVGDTTKPPESMVQCTVAVNVGEYDRWRHEESVLGRSLRATVPSFYDPARETVVRWLPGEPFSASQAEENMNHDAMDSWYLHHTLFNLSRFAREGDADARDLFARSLPYIIRVAHRFAYRWPIFFHLTTLDIIRAEAEPGRGGERDVAGLYALVMLHAHELFADDAYLAEAEAAAAQMRGFGFYLAYQVNTTGFAAEAALRLWLTTNERQYLELSEVCMANLFDNLWLWECRYGYAAGYRTFFALFPLRDAPYVAPYEELEALAKFHEHLRLGGEDVRPSLRLLVAEFQKYALDRCWYYYPDVLASDGIAETVRNGVIRRSLSVPLEDLRDGRERSGQVGQEIYGAGLPFVVTARCYVKLAGGALAYCSYPIEAVTEYDDDTVTWTAVGDPRCTAELRVLFDAAPHSPRAVSVWMRAGTVRVPLEGHTSVEGHAVFTIRGGQTIEIRCTEPARIHDERAVLIGPLVARTS